MRIRPILFLLLCATGAAAQIPTLTNAAKIRYVQGNTVFDRPASDLLALVGAENISVTGNWNFSSNLTQLKDAGTYFYDDADNTKLFRFQASGINTATTRNYTMPNADGTIALTGAAYGGTGQSAVAQGDLLYGSATDTWSRLAKNTSATRYLSNTGTSNNPAWAQINLTNGVTGTLPVANGGTGIVTLTANRIPYGNGTSAFQSSASLTYDGTTLTGSPRITTSGTESVSISINTQNVTSILTGTANSLTLRGMRLDSRHNNDGTVTGNSLYGFDGSILFGNTNAATAGSAIGGFFYTQTYSPNISQVRGLYMRLDERSASGNLANRTGGQFDLYKYVLDSDGHTGIALQGQIADGTTNGRWNSGTGLSFAATNCLTGYGINMTVLNQRGTGNTQYGLYMNNNATGVSTLVSNAYGVYLSTSAGTSGNITNYYGIYNNTSPTGATLAYFLYGGSSSNRNYLAGNLSIGVDVTTAKLFVRGDGTTSGTYELITEKSDGTDVFLVRDDGMSAFGTTPVSTEKLLVRGATSDNTAKAFVAERSSGTDVLGVQNDGKVSINNAAYTEELTINGQAQLDGVIFTNVTGSTTASGHMVYTDDATHGGYVTIGDGDRQLAIMPTMIERHVLDWAVNWSTGRKGAFWTVPARFNNWKISKAYISITAIGAGAGDDELSIEIGGVVEGVQIVTAGTHTLVMDDVINTDDVITFNITAISATPAQGLHVSLELSKN